MGRALITYTFYGSGRKIGKMEKVRHVLRARQSRKHGCHWPGCPEQVPPAKWGCYRHWMMPPKYLRDRIWAAYSPGQEERMDPSDSYLSAAEAVQEWIREHRK